MRYWRGNYDEDEAREAQLCRDHGINSQEEERDVWFFRVLVGLQAALLILMALLYVNWP